MVVRAFDRTHTFTSWGLSNWADELTAQNHPFADALRGYARAWEEDVADAMNHGYEQGAQSHD